MGCQAWGCDGFAIGGVFWACQGLTTLCRLWEDEGMPTTVSSHPFYRHTCAVCGKSWESTKLSPRQCGGCWSRRWNVSPLQIRKLPKAAPKS